VAITRSGVASNGRPKSKLWGMPLECAVTPSESPNHKYIGAGTVDDVATTIQDPDKTNLVQYPLKPLE